MRSPFLSSAVFIGIVALATPALAHAHLLRAVPAAGSTVKASPTELRLKFSEGLELAFSGVTVTGSDHAAIKIGAPSLDPADPAVLVVPLPGDLKPGRYAVDWHATATDTHKTKGRYDFTLTP
ncbi:MAG TPA: copper homeostasis periplasmic binding protein CopC [Lichenihabitans sp.]|jgi:hypothetical protein|nr:copper homeostasis periplasmic binding protein CopC [Lichenihabitans sp.]